MAGVGKVFISYRREDAADAAGRIRDWLVQTWHYAKGDVFMDVTGILPGADFMQVIDQTISRCQAMIVVISPSWLAQVNTPDATLRMEVEAALRHNLLVIPVLVNGAQMPTADQLPPSLRTLIRKNIKAVRADSFAFDMDFVRRALGVRTGLGVPWIAAISAVLLVSVSLGILSQTPPVSDNPVWYAFHQVGATATATATAIPTDTLVPPTATPLAASSILDRAVHTSLRNAWGRIGTDSTFFTTGGANLTASDIGIQTNPNRLYLHIEVSSSGGQFNYLEQVTDLGTNTNYSRTACCSAPWAKSSGGAGSIQTSALDYFYQYFTLPTLSGTELLNGWNVYHLVQEQVGNTSATPIRKVEAWIRTDDFYPVQFTLYIDVSRSGVESIDSQVYTFTQWNIDRAIAIPTA